MADVAQQIGCTSEFAFAKALKRDYGPAPGVYRSQATAGPDTAPA